MCIFKSSSPENRPLGSPFPAIVPQLGFQVVFEKIFFFCECVQEAIWKVSVNSLIPWVGEADRSSLFLKFSPCFLFSQGLRLGPLLGCGLYLCR